MHALPSVMDHKFSLVPQAEIQRSSFDRSHGHKTTFDTGYLVPIYRDIALPGDTFHLSATVLARLSSTALQKPIMDNLYLETFWFACPMRLIWSNFEKFMGAQDNPGDSTTFLVPQMPSPTTPGIVSGSLSDYLGLPVGLASSFNFNSWWHRMYNLTWNQWFRDQNMQNSVTVDTGNGPDTYSNYVLLRRGKRHDYFTSCLTAPQKGTALTIPLGTSANVLTAQNELVTAGTYAMTIRQAGGAVLGSGKALGTDTTTSMAQTNTATTSAGGNAIYPTNLYADLTNATASTINALRLSIALQQMLEIDARGGTRYTEVIRAHFGGQAPLLRRGGLLLRCSFAGRALTTRGIFGFRSDASECESCCWN